MHHQWVTIDFAQIHELNLRSSVTCSIQVTWQACMITLILQA